MDASLSYKVSRGGVFSQPTYVSMCYSARPLGCHAPHLPFGTQLISPTDEFGKDLPLTTVAAASSLGLDP